MSNELLSILGGKPATTPKPSKAAAKNYDPYDAAIRTVLAEESDPTAQEWVAGVIANRAKKSGKNFYEVVTEENQFEPWARGTAQAVDPSSKAYKEAATRVRDILDGKRDPSEGAMNFYAPEAQAELSKKDGRPAKAEFDDGTGIRVGKTLFFRPGGTQGGSELASVLGAPSPEKVAEADADFAKAFGDPAKYDKAEMTGAGVVPYTSGIKDTLDAEQTKVLGTFEKGGYIDRKEPAGSIRNPLWMTSETSEKDVPPGAYYVTRGKDATLKRAEGGPDNEPDRNLMKSLAQGFSDVGLSVANLAPGTEDSTIRNRMVADQMAYDADLKGDLPSGIARFTGQVIPSTVALAGGEALAAPAIGGSALGRFVLGKAGAEMAPGVASAATKVASRAAQGARVGAEGAALTSSASDQPLEEQMKSAAIVGGVLRPAAPLAAKAGQKVGSAVRDFVEPWTHSGREKGVERILGKVAGEDVKLDLRELVPGSKPTMAEASGNAGLATLERQARTNPQLIERFNERLRDNAAARKDFFGSIAKDGEAITEAKDAREAATAALREAAFKSAKPADAAPVVAKIDEILKGPAGKRDTVTKALTNLRGKLETDGGLESDVQQLYGVRKAIGDMLDPLGPSETKGAVLAKRELMDVKAALDKAIEKAAPGFKGYLKTYEDMSKPINEMEYLQSLNLADSKGVITLSKVQTAIDRIEKAQKAGGTNKQKSISKATMDGLYALRDDLKRSGNIDLGKARGSDTVQNAAMGRFAADEGMPILGSILGTKVPGAQIAIGMGKKALEGKSAKAVDQLAARLLYPEAPLKNVTPKRAPPVPLGEVALPVVGGQFTSSVRANQ